MGRLEAPHQRHPGGPRARSDRVRHPRRPVPGDPRPGRLPGAARRGDRGRGPRVRPPGRHPGETRVGRGRGAELLERLGAQEERPPRGGAVRGCALTADPAHVDARAFLADVLSLTGDRRRRAPGEGEPRLRAGDVPRLNRTPGSRSTCGTTRKRPRSPSTAPSSSAAAGPLGADRPRPWRSSAGAAATRWSGADRALRLDPENGYAHRARAARACCSPRTSTRRPRPSARQRASSPTTTPPTTSLGLLLRRGRARTRPKRSAGSGARRSCRSSSGPTSSRPCAGPSSSPSRTCSRSSSAAARTRRSTWAWGSRPRGARRCRSTGCGARWSSAASGPNRRACASSRSCTRSSASPTASSAASRRRARVHRGSFSGRLEDPVRAGQ